MNGWPRFAGAELTLLLGTSQVKRLLERNWTASSSVCSTTASWIRITWYAANILKRVFVRDFTRAVCYAWCKCAWTSCGAPFYFLLTFVFFQSFSGHRPKCFWNGRKKLSNFSPKVEKYRLMNTVTAILIQLWDKWPKCLSERKNRSTLPQSPQHSPPHRVWFWCFQACLCQYSLMVVEKCNDDRDCQALLAADRVSADRAISFLNKGTRLGSGFVHIYSMFVARATCCRSVVLNVFFAHSPHLITSNPDRSCFRWYVNLMIKKVQSVSVKKHKTPISWFKQALDPHHGGNAS